MSQSMVNFRLDDEIKKSLDATCRELGMSTTTAFTIFARKVVREKRIPFDIAIDPFYSEENISAIKNSISQINNGQVVVRTLSELES